MSDRVADEDANTKLLALVCNPRELGELIRRQNFWVDEAEAEALDGGRKVFVERLRHVTCQCTIDSNCTCTPSVL